MFLSLHTGTQNVESENHRLKARGIRAQRPLPALVHTLQRVKVIGCALIVLFFLGADSRARDRG